MLLVKQKTTNAFRLAVYKGARLIATISSNANPWEVTWDPSGKCISYLAEGNIPGTYVLTVWWVDSNKVAVVNAPITHSAAFPVRWSPNGRSLAYVDYAARNSKLLILSVHGRSAGLDHIIPGINPGSGFAWSADSSSLVFSTSLPPFYIDSYNLVDHSTRHVFSLNFADSKDLSWAPSPQIAVSVRPRNEAFYRLVLLTETGHATYCRPGDGDVHNPVWVNAQSELYYLVQKNTNDSILISRGCSDSKVIASMQAGSMRLQNDGYKHSELPLFESGPFHPPILFVLKKQQMIALHPEHSDTRYRSIGATQIWIHGAGHLVPAWLWAKGSSTRGDRAIVIVHGGPHLHESAEWDPLRQALAQDGFTILAVNYSGSTGYGADFENTDRPDVQASDLAASVRYLEASRGIKAEHIVVVASSYGTTVLLNALRQNPDLCKVIVFAPFLGGGDEYRNSEPIDFEGIVLAFHGARDPISRPEAAFYSLSTLFSNKGVKNKFYWRTFDDEAHGFARINSLQEIYGTIVCAANAACAASL
jgi:dipeptidyl aminopeptidase/acylaminoacyl peptidase